MGSLIFEATNAPMLVNALETTALVVLFARGVWRRSWAHVWQTLVRSPMLMFGLAFVGTFGVAVGLASTNLGMLLGHRVPLVSLFAALVLVVGASRRLETPARAGPHKISPLRHTLMGTSS